MKAESCSFVIFHSVKACVEIKVKDGLLRCFCSKLFSSEDISSQPQSSQVEQLLSWTLHFHPTTTYLPISWKEQNTTDLSSGDGTAHWMLGFAMDAR